MAGDNSLLGKYEFLDHTADVQIHAWGDDLKETFENAAVAMIAYITDIKTIDVSFKETIRVQADDLTGLFYRYLDEVLFLFNADPYLLSKNVKILELKTDSKFEIVAECHGETFTHAKHTQGTEIKAVTYSAMKIVNEPSRHEVYFIVDI